MPASKKQAYARYTLAAVKLLGALVQQERKVRRMPAQNLAERLGVARGTVRRLELGDPKVELGLAFEACAVLGISLFDEDSDSIARRLDEVGARVALLPKYARPRGLAADDDF